MNEAIKEDKNKMDYIGIIKDNYGLLGRNAH